MSEILLPPQTEREVHHYAPPMEREVAEEDVIAPNDVIHAKHIGDVLARHYPGHAWMVHVNGKQGIAIVRNQMLNGQWGYVIRLPAVFSASDLDKQAMKAGGEILERFQMRRGRFDGEDWAGLPTNVAGVPLFFKD